MIFGGVTNSTDDDEENQAIDNGQKVQVTN